MLTVTLRPCAGDVHDRDPDAAVAVEASRRSSAPAGRREIRGRFDHLDLTGVDPRPKRSRSRRPTEVATSTSSTSAARSRRRSPAPPESSSPISAERMPGMLRKARRTSSMLTAVLGVTDYLSARRPRGLEPLAGLHLGAHACLRCGQPPSWPAAFLPGACRAFVSSPPAAADGARLLAFGGVDRCAQRGHQVEHGAAGRPPARPATPPRGRRPSRR